MAWLVVLAAAIVALHALGRGALAAPPVADGTAALRAWARDRDAPTVVMALLRLVTVGLAWYLLVSSVAGIAARLTHLAPLVRATDSLTLPLVRRLLSGATGMALISAPLSLAGPARAGVSAAHFSAAASPAAASPSAVGSAAGGGAVGPGSGSGTLTMRRLPDIAARDRAGGTGQGHGADHAGAPDEPPVLRPLPPGIPAPAPPVAPAAPQPPVAPPQPPVPVVPASPGPPAAPVPAGPDPSPPPAPGSAEVAGLPAPAAPVAATWTVQPGDSFWRGADAIWRQARGRPPTPAELDGYWRTLINANRHNLADPHNPDLLYPGQVMQVPRPPPPP